MNHQTEVKQAVLPLSCHHCWQQSSLLHLWGYSHISVSPDLSLPELLRWHSDTGEGQEQEHRPCCTSLKQNFHEKTQGFLPDSVKGPQGTFSCHRLYSSHQKQASVCSFLPSTWDGRAQTGENLLLGKPHNPKGRICTEFLAVTSIQAAKTKRRGTNFPNSLILTYILKTLLWHWMSHDQN